MCEPTLILAGVSAAVSAAGGMMSASAMNEQISQQNAFQRQMMENNRKMRQAELVRQDEMRRQQEAALVEGEKNLTGEARTKQIEDATAEAEKNIKDIQNDVTEATTAVPGLIESASANNVVAEGDYAKRLAAAAADSRKKIAALTNLGAYDLAAGNRAMEMDKTAETINRINNFRKGSLAVAETGIGLNDMVAKGTTIGPQTGMLAAGSAVSGLGNLIGSATAGGTAQNAVKNLFA